MSEFQSSPGGDAERNRSRPWCGFTRECFNPRPAVTPSATGAGVWPPCPGSPGFNPRPAVTPSATPSTGPSTGRARSFNPRPAVTPSATVQEH